MLVIALYSIVRLNTVVEQNVYMTLGRSLGHEVLAYQEGTASPSPSLVQFHRARHRAYTVVHIQLVTRGMIFVATIGYVVHRAGYIG